MNKYKKRTTPKRPKKKVPYNISLNSYRTKEMLTLGYN